MNRVLQVLFLSGWTQVIRDGTRKVLIQMVPCVSVLRSEAVKRSLCTGVLILGCAA